MWGLWGFREWHCAFVVLTLCILIPSSRLKSVFVVCICACALNGHMVFLLCLKLCTILLGWRYISKLISGNIYFKKIEMTVPTLIISVTFVTPFKVLLCLQLVRENVSPPTPWVAKKTEWRMKEVSDFRCERWGRRASLCFYSSWRPMRSVTVLRAVGEGPAVLESSLFSPPLAPRSNC